MGNKATTIYEQIELLKARGMIIDDIDIDKAYEHLLDIGYYRLGFYWYYFESDKKHGFKDGTNLNNAIDLYYFDVDLRNLLSKYLYRIEVHFRTQLIYFASNKYRESPVWYSDENIVVSSYLDKLKLVYNKNFKNNNLPIKRHHKKYINDSYAPAWKAIEFFTFGQVFLLFKSLKDEALKSDIALKYDIKDIHTFENHISCIINIRNICSHSAVLFDFNQPFGIRKIPSTRYRNKTRNQTNLNSSLRLILFILSKVSQNRADDLEVLLQDFFASNMSNDVLKDIIETHVCFDL